MSHNMFVHTMCIKHCVHITSIHWLLNFEHPIMLTLQYDISFSLSLSSRINNTLLRLMLNVEFMMIIFSLTHSVIHLFRLFALNDSISHQLIKLKSQVQSPRIDIFGLSFVTFSEFVHIIFGFKFVLFHTIPCHSILFPCVQTHMVGTVAFISLNAFIVDAANCLC